MKSIKTSLLLATVLASSVAFAADGPRADQTTQLDTDKYDVNTIRKADPSEPPQAVVLIATGQNWTKDIMLVDAKSLPPVLVTIEKGKQVSGPPTYMPRYDLVQKQNSFQYKYVPKRKSAAAASDE